MMGPASLSRSEPPPPPNTLPNMPPLQPAHRESFRSSASQTGQGGMCYVLCAMCYVLCTRYRVYTLYFIQAASLFYLRGIQHCCSVLFYRLALPLCLGNLDARVQESVIEWE
jgi:hypothetical protein